VSGRQPSAQRTIFDDFEGYRSPTDDDYVRVLTQGLVIPDANVLLNLYRYTARTRTDLFAVLKKIRGQLWVPHQVVAEFWRNRESALREPQALDTKAMADLEEKCEQSTEVLRTWSNRIALAPEEVSRLEEKLREAFQKVVSSISSRADAGDSRLSATSTQSDPILRTLNSILKGRIGPPMEAGAYKAAVEEGERRIREGLPPGFMDKGKNSDHAVGDYLVWAQILDEASARNCDVLFVTADVKEDWWRKEHGQARGPHLDLVRELRQRAGTQLFLQRPDSLLIHAKTLLSIDVSDASVQDAERVERSRPAQQTESDNRYHVEKLPEGRTGNYLQTLIEMTRLAEERSDLDGFIDAFQERFPTITLREEARRRIRNLASLGLAEIGGNRIAVTSLGQRLLYERSLDLVQDSFLTRIAGAMEIRDLATNLNPSELRSRIRDNPPAGLSATQATLVLRWLEQLELV
jgi:PIN like domain